MIPHTALPGHFFLHPPFRQVALDPGQGKDIWPKGGHMQLLGESAFATATITWAKLCGPQSSIAQVKSSSSRKPGLARVKSGFCLTPASASQGNSERNVPLSRLTSASELIFAEYLELPS